MTWETLKDIFGYDPKEPMLFNSGLFFIFFTIFLVIYSFIYENRNARLFSIITFSLFFYFKSSGIYLLLFIGTIILDYFIALQIEKTEGKKRKVFLVLSILASVGLLCYFKYTGFLFTNINFLFGAHLAIPDLFLPIGISFYTFQSISYIVDVYSRKIKASQSFVDYAFYMSFFPHLVAGPIVRAEDFLPQVRRKVRITGSMVDEGLFRITKGVLKKAVIADYLALYVDMIYAAPSHYSGFENLIAMYAYAIQIYCDFSGYCDMAIGFALLMGFRLKENFNAPYIAQNITDFWRRWHISLSNWLRDYIYIPMGGNRKGRGKQYLFLLLTMLIGGLWHRPFWRYVIWGGLHGIALIVHKIFAERYGKYFPNKRWVTVLSWFITFHFVAIVWLLFRLESFDAIGETLTSIFTDFDWSYFIPFYHARTLLSLMLLLGFAIHFISAAQKDAILLWFRNSSWLMKASCFLIIVQIVIQLKSENIQPFIYFQF